MGESGSVLVTGGSGFIGSHVCSRLLAKGVRVLCLDQGGGSGGPAATFVECMPDKFTIPKFATEAEEAGWWVSHQNLVADQFEQAAKSGQLRHGSVAQIAHDRTAGKGVSPTITIRLPEDDIARARTQAARKGLRYQTYLKMLLHEALDREDRAS